MSLKRHRVVLRPKVRSQRVRQALAVAGLLVLGALAAAALRHAPISRPSWAGIKARLLPAVASIKVEGISDRQAAEVLAYLGGRQGGAQSASAAELLARFEFLKYARVARDWRGSTLRFELDSHAALGEVLSRGRAEGYLSEAGTVFRAPERLYAAGLPAVERGTAGAEELKALAGYLAAVSGAGKLPSPVARLRFVSSGDGWEVRLQDGTTILWGSFDFTAQKIARLGEVLADARGRAQGTLAADLRFFEDGKVLLRPLGAKAGSLR